MTVVDTRKDPDACTLTIVAEFDAPPERVWQVWSDPRQLERWWGPPEYPATVEDHELVTGGRVSYFMTSPEGEKYPGWWRVDEVDPPHRLVFTDGFADDEGEANDDLPVTTTEVTIEGLDADRARMTMLSRFGSVEAMEQILEMGAEEGMVAALGQIDDLLHGDG